MKWLADFLAPVWETAALTFLFGLVAGMCLIAGRGSVVFAARFIKSLRTGKWDGNGTHASANDLEEARSELKDLTRKVDGAHTHHAKEHAAIVTMLEQDAERGRLSTAKLGEVAEGLRMQAAALDRLNQRLDHILAGGGK